MKDRYWLVARDKPGLLIAVMKVLAGNAHISFEGDLSRCPLRSIPGALDQETDVLKRNTLYPRQDFVVLPLEPDTIRPVLDAVLPEGRVVHDVIHVQIEKNGVLEFGSYDNFHPECIGPGPSVSVAVLEELKVKGVLHSYQPTSDKS